MRFTFCPVAFFAIFLVVSCAPVVTPTPTPSALPPATSTSWPSPTSAPLAQPSATPSPAPTPTDQANCYNAALYLADVSFPDNTRLNPGEAFTKTWRLQNTGTCTWNARYRLQFAGGERMAAPEFVPLAETQPGASLEISLPLTAPGADGFYTGLYSLRDPLGQPIAIGGLTSIWVKIRVGDGSAPLSATPGPGGVGSNPATPRPSGGECQPSPNPAYVADLFQRINAARVEANLKPLNLDGRLSAAAQGHSLDMACNNFLSHSGSNGSWIGDRVAAAGYVADNYTEIIAIGAPQDALNQWAADAVHWNAVLDPTMKDVGVGYVYVAASNFGGYWAVVFGRP